jgi:hypothetical protein
MAPSQVAAWLCEISSLALASLVSSSFNAWQLTAFGSFVACRHWHHALRSLRSSASIKKMAV